MRVRFQVFRMLVHVSSWFSPHERNSKTSRSKMEVDTPRNKAVGTSGGPGSDRLDRLALID